MSNELKNLAVYPVPFILAFLLEILPIFYSFFLFPQIVDCGVQLIGLWGVLIH